MKIRKKFNQLHHKTVKQILIPLQLVLNQKERMFAKASQFNLQPNYQLQLDKNGKFVDYSICGNSQTFLKTYYSQHRNIHNQQLKPKPQIKKLNKQQKIKRMLSAKNVQNHISNVLKQSDQESQRKIKRLQLSQSNVLKQMKKRLILSENSTRKQENFWTKNMRQKYQMKTEWNNISQFIQQYEQTKINFQGLLRNNAYEKWMNKYAKQTKMPHVEIIRRKGNLYSTFSCFKKPLYSLQKMKKYKNILKHTKLDVEFLEVVGKNKLKKEKKIIDEMHQSQSIDQRQIPQIKNQTLQKWDIKELSKKNTLFFKNLIS